MIRRRSCTWMSLTSVRSSSLACSGFSLPTISSSWSGGVCACVARTAPPSLGSPANEKPTSPPALEPCRPQPGLTAIDCRRAQRQHLAAAARRVWISQSVLVAPAEEPGINDARAQTDTPTRAGRERSLYIERPFSGRTTHTPPRKLTRHLQPRPASPRRVSAVSSRPGIAPCFLSTGAT